jgi:hypothetical protein
MSYVGYVAAWFTGTAPKKSVFTSCKYLRTPTHESCKVLLRLSSWKKKSVENTWNNYEMIIRILYYIHMCIYIYMYIIYIHTYIYTYIHLHIHLKLVNSTWNIMHVIISAIKNGNIFQHVS